jgi:hypothetical protein
MENAFPNQRQPSGMAKEKSDMFAEFRIMVSPALMRATRIALFCSFLAVSALTTGDG